MNPRVTCYCDVDLVHAAYPVTGLIELADAGEIELQFRLRDASFREYRGHWTLWLRGEFANDAADICIDLHDSPTYFCEPSLRRCRLYYKVNLGPRTYEALPADEHHKLRPFGPYLPCRPRSDRGLVRRRFGSFTAKFRHRFFQSTKSMSLPAKVRNVAAELRRYKRYLSRKTWPEYESPPSDDSSTGVEPLVYNPACWDESEGDEIRRMNESRASLILALRAEFGEQFVGGLRRNETAAAKYAEAVEPRDFSHDEYLRLLHAAPIAIYTHGKWGCFSWRLIEEMAAGKVVVSEPPVNESTFPYDERSGIVVCPTIETMVATVKDLCANPKRVRELRQKSWATYCEFLKPTASMRRVLESDDVKHPLESLN